MEIGDHIPKCSLPDKNGEAFNIGQGDGNGKIAVIYFYPKDFTPGCTIEACHFRDFYKDFKEMGAEVTGISPDSVRTHHKFSVHFDIPYLLLSDPKGVARKKFGVENQFFGTVPRRETFIFDKKGTLRSKISRFSPARHIKEALATVKNLVDED